MLETERELGIHVTFLVKKLGMSRPNMLYALDDLVGYQVLSKHTVHRKKKRGRPLRYYRLENRLFAKDLISALNNLNVRLYGKTWKKTAKEHYELIRTEGEHF
jgi:predicted ArsR family transcriptional regulator